MKPMLTLAALALSLTSATVRAEVHAEKCDPIPKEEWKPQTELERKLKDQGWKVSRVKITNGCYEVYGRDEKNGKVEVFFHPKTFERVTAAK